MPRSTFAPSSIRGPSPLALLPLALLACSSGDQAANETENATDNTSATATSASDSADTSTDAPSTGTGTASSSSSSSSSSDSDTADTPDEPTVFMPKQGLVPAELAVLVNTDDPLSTAIADYYMEARQIPPENRVELSFPLEKTLSPELFAELKTAVDDALGPDIQALALTWTTPYRVGCMSITSAFALGFDEAYCSTPCNPTKPSGLYSADVERPYSELGIRLAMSLAATSEENAKALIDRGIAADNTFPTGDGYLVRTTDKARSVRWPAFISTVDAWQNKDKDKDSLALTYIDNADGMGSDLIADTENVLFYFTGLANVGEITSNSYLPGALADHLTSYGGQVPESSQMSVIKWLEAGVSGSYGTVVEPCNYPEKFPNTTVLLPNYFRGQTIVEAYWKSVAWPGEGLFVGEPLARPWGASTVLWNELDATLTITTTLLDPSKTYQLLAAESEEGPWTPVLTDISIDAHALTEIVYGPTEARFYRLEAL